MAYEFIERIYEGISSLIYRVRNTETNDSFIMKVLKNEHPEAEDVQKLKHEFDLLEELKSPGIIRCFDYTRYKGVPAIVLEDFGAVSLSKVLDKKQLDITTFLKWSLRIADALSSLHEKDIIHKDIKPHNILVNPDTEEIKLIDFGIASIAGSITDEPESVKFKLRGTLAYISPEQTGRINQRIDKRSDLYSLGITFYEMLTNQLPFQSKDPMELIHSHIAVMPVSPMELNPNIPSSISKIVMKLLEKNADERYQNIKSLRSDLEVCLEQHLDGRDIDNIEIGLQDIEQELRISNKLYERDKELSRLVELFGSSKQHSLIVSISGNEGIGKTSLINEFLSQIIEHNPLFLKGSYDEQSHHVPYSAIIKGLDKIIHQILKEKNEIIKHYKDRILKTLGRNGQIIIDVIPSLELIIGKQSEAVELGATESQNRFNILFQDFIKVFSDKPLIVFLDKVQHIDTASLTLLENILLNVENNNIFIILEYRKGSVDSGHSLTSTIDKVKDANSSLINEIELSPLSEQGVKQLISDSLSLNVDKISDLADIIIKKTYGNPFFVKHFIETIYNNELLAYDTDNSEWVWKIEAIKELHITDNLAEIMITNINKLSDNTISILKVTSCQGLKFNIDILEEINNKSEAENKELLREALNSGIVIQTGEKSYSFTHSTIQTTLYNLLTDEEKQEIHLAIGRHLINNSGSKSIEDNITDIVRHLNISREKIKNESEVINLIKLNLKASNKMLSTYVFEPALSYSKIAVDLLKPDFWETEYELCLNVYNTVSECELYLTNYDGAEKYLNVIFENAKNELERIEAYKQFMSISQKQGKFDKAIESGIEAIKHFDIELPFDKEKTIKSVEKDYEEVKRKLQDKNTDYVYTLPMNNDKKYSMMLKILGDINVCSNYIGRKDLGHLAVLKIIKLQLDYGNIEGSSQYYAMYGIFIKRKGLLDEAYNWGKVSIKLAEKINNPFYSSLTYNIVGGFLSAIKDDKATGLKYRERAYRLSMEVGDWETAGKTMINLSLTKFYLDESLKTILNTVEEGIQFAKKIKNKTQESLNRLIQRMILALRGRTDSKTSFSSDGFDEYEFLKTLKENNSKIEISWYYSFKAKVMWVYEDFEGIIKLKKEAEKFNDFYYAVAISSIYDSVSEELRQEGYKILKDTLDSSKNREIKIDSEEGFLFLVEAEFNKIEDRGFEALKSYEKSIKNAQLRQCMFDLGVCNEFAGKFCLSKDMEYLARYYLTEAYYIYKVWGADGKVKVMEAKYKDLLSATQSEKALRVKDNTISFDSVTSEKDLLDLSTVVKMSQAISSEIILDKLLEKLLKIVIENAGGQKGVFILEQSGELFIQGEINIAKDEIHVLQQIPVEKSNSVAESIVNYTYRTKDNLVLKNATEDESYNYDKYIRENQPKSIICMPLINQGKVVGILYLENNITIGAFTAERIEMLKMMSSQIAISIENAELYTKLDDYNKTLEEKVKQRTKELNKMNEELTNINQQLLRELEMAQRVQMSIIPKDKDFPDRKELAFGSDYSSMESIGGDLYDVIRVGRNGYGFLMADVSGHGVPAALITAMAKVSFNSNTNWGSDTATVCDLVHQEIYNLIGDLEYYLTAYYCILNLETGELQYTNCAHHPAVLYRSDTKEIIQLDTDGFFIGAFEESMYETKKIILSKGDRLLLFTDGIIEARNEDDLFYGYDRLMTYIKENSHKNPEVFVNDLVKDVSAFCGTKPPDDDRAVLYIEFLSTLSDNKPIEEAIKVEAKQISEKTDDAKSNEQDLNELQQKVNEYIKKNEYEKALEVLIPAQEDYPANIGILNSLGVVYYKLERLEDARKIFESAIDLDSDNKKVKKNLSIVNKKLNH